MEQILSMQYKHIYTSKSFTEAMFLMNTCQKIALDNYALCVRKIHAFVKHIPVNFHHCTFTKHNIKLYSKTYF